MVHHKAPDPKDLALDQEVGKGKASESSSATAEGSSSRQDHTSSGDAEDTNLTATTKSSQSPVQSPGYDMSDDEGFRNVWGGDDHSK